MTSLPEDLEILLEAERDIDVPAPAQRQRMFARLEPLLMVPVALAAGASSVVTTAGPSSVVTTAEATASAAVGGFIKAKVAAAVVSAALLGGAVGATGHAYFASPPPGSTDAPSVPAVPRATVTGLAPEPARSPSAEPAATPSASSVPLPSERRQERSLAVGSLRAERLLLEAASAALMRGDRASAILSLRKHAQRFPAGALAEERKALMKRAVAAETP
jgi:hypothetical protein